jgi:hypothetical protein
VAKDGAIGTDDRGVGSHTGGGNTEHLAGVFEGHFCGWGVDGNDPADKSFSFGFANLVSEHD